MRQFFISTHGHMASGLKSSIEILCGKQDNVIVYDAYVEESGRVEDAVEAFLAKLDPNDQAILCSDLYGGSVNQVLYRYLGPENVFLIAGVNLALLLELVAMSSEPITAEQIDETIKMSREAMIQCKLDATETKEEEFF